MKTSKVLAGLLCGIALLSLAGCGRSLDFLVSSAANALGLGSMRVYQAGDKWNFSLTGTYVDASGTVAITPDTATLVFSNTPTAIGPVTDANTLTLTVPISHPTYSAIEVFVIAFKQLVNGTMNIYGIAPNSGLSAITSGGGFIPGPDASAFDTLTGWNATATTALYGAFTITATKQGIETVAVGGKSYQCYKITGTKSLGGFPSSFTVWVNPQTGTFVKMMTSYTDTLGTTNLMYEMQ